MASRYPVYKKYDYCLSPVRVNTSKGFSYVPCGKCSGCLVHKANSWCQRLSMEIDNSSHTLFFTLTYTNDFLPYLVKCSSIEKKYFRDKDGSILSTYGCVFWISDHGANYRAIGFDGQGFPIRVQRKDGICIPDYNFDPVPVTNFDGEIIPYVSKRDFQLYLKIVRKNLSLSNATINKFRSFCVSEYGETKFRPHMHVLAFCDDETLAKELQSHILYESWAMCDKDRFYNYCTFADSGASSYVSQYLTCNTLLPKVYQAVKELQPFRLSSKNPAIGYKSFNESVFDKVQRGDLEYDRVIDRIDKRYLFRYSSDYLASLFPKCTGFSSCTFERLLSVYGFLLQVVDRYNEIEGRAYRDFHDVLSTYCSSQDWRAMQVASRVCKGQGWSIFHYVYTLDMVYYKLSMYALKRQYESMQDHPLSTDWFGIYTNLPDLVSSYWQHQLSLDKFFEPFGICVNDLLGFRLEDWYPKPYSDNYILELHTILEDMIKMPKFNELAGCSPSDV